MKKRIAVRVMVCMLAAVGMMMLPVVSGAAVLDLTTAGSSGSIGTAQFLQIEANPTGSGVIDSFVRIQANGTEQGYNTGFRPVEFNENTSPTFTRNLLLSAVPIVNIGGTNYREFLLDINQTANNPLLSLDSLQLFTSNTADAHGYPGALGTLVYDLDAGGNNTILLNYVLESGSGQGDMFAYIPSALFTGNYVYLFSAFGLTGGNYASNDGYEEWSVRTAAPVPPIPEPGTMLLLGSGLVGLAGWGRKKFRK